MEKKVIAWVAWEFRRSLVLTVKMITNNYLSVNGLALTATTSLAIDLSPCARFLYESYHPGERSL